MKNLLPIVILLSIFSCKKSKETNSPKVDSTKIIDSINVARTKINDSILSSRAFKDLSGTHSLTHDLVNGSGKITFTKIRQDEYKISGENKSGSNFVKIEGNARMTSPRNFSTKDGGKTFKLYESVNSAGFADKIMIKL